MTEAEQADLLKELIVVQRGSTIKSVTEKIEKYLHLSKTVEFDYEFLANIQALLKSSPLLSAEELIQAP